MATPSEVLNNMLVSYAARTAKVRDAHGRMVPQAPGIATVLRDPEFDRASFTEHLARAVKVPGRLRIDEVATRMGLQFAHFRHQLEQLAWYGFRRKRTDGTRIQIATEFAMDRSGDGPRFLLFCPDGCCAAGVVSITLTVDTP
jgi:hypothetical protein